MTKTDIPEFYGRLAALTELFDAPTFSDAKAELYFDALKDLPLERVIDGLSQAAKTCKFMPRPAEIRQLALGDVEDRAEAAWMLFRKAMQRVGAYASIAVEDPALGEAILAMFGSWAEACTAEFSSEMWTAKRKEFSRVYKVLCGRQLVGTRYLAGQCEQSNTFHGMSQKHVPVHVLTGSDVWLLPAAKVEDYKQQISARAHGFSRLRDAMPEALAAVGSDAKDEVS